jgi:hypothetical protein
MVLGFRDGRRGIIANISGLQRRQLRIKMTGILPNLPLRKRKL